MKKSTLVSAMLLIAATTAQAQMESTTELLEQGIYAEQTVGDLQQAISIYDQIVKDADNQRPEVAQALFRLAACYEALGDNAKASELLQRLIREYPDQPEITAQARKLLTPGRLALGPVPWQSGEVAYYQFRRGTGGNIGTVARSVKSTIADGVPAWEFEQHSVIMIAGLLESYNTYVTEDSFELISSDSVNSLVGNYKADYDAEGISLQSEVKGQTSSKDIEVEAPYYNDEQLAWAMRRMPLTKGYKAEFPVFSQSDGSLYEVKLEVGVIEPVSVPAGDFDSHKISVDYSQGGRVVRQSSFWISADQDRLLVKHEHTGVAMELTRVENHDARPLSYSNQDLSIALDMPEGWVPLQIDPLQPGHDLWLSMMPDRAHTFALLAATKRARAKSGDDADKENQKLLQLIVVSDEKAISSALGNYTLRPESQVDLEVDGAIAKRFTGDFDEGGKAMVEHRTYILADTGLYWFTFRSEREVFDQYKDEYDAIVANLRFN